MTMVWEAARVEARKLREQHDTTDPFEICRALGVDVYRTPMPDGSSGMIVKKAGEAAEIFIEANDVPARQRFTAAHELGHLIERANFANDDDYSFRDRRGMERDIHEFFADEFAGELLMPEEEFLDLWEVRKMRTSDLANHFGVSLAAVEARRGRLMKHRTA